jgi:hypothetical protein
MSMASARIAIGAPRPASCRQSPLLAAIKTGLGALRQPASRPYPQPVDTDRRREYQAALKVENLPLIVVTERP